MSTLIKPEVVPEPISALVTAAALIVALADGRSITVPLLWFPRLRHGSAKERANFELGRNGIHWPDLDEDIAVAGLLNGEKSGESLASIQRWLDARKKKMTLDDQIPDFKSLKAAIPKTETKTIALSDEINSIKTIDYKETLSPADFAIFAKLRDVRKAIAQTEAVPVYTIFTNEQLAQMVGSKATDRAALAKIDGVGDARLDKYGPRFLAVLTSAWAGETVAHEASGKPV